MAWIAEFGSFIHIPKTSGNWVVRVLRQLGHINVKGPWGFTSPSVHGYPDRWDYPVIFAVVRNPADWLRSAWWSRVDDKWKPYPESVPWSAFCSMVKPYETDNFEEFAEDVMNNFPGIVGWMFDVYTPPPVQVVRMGEETTQFLRDLGCDPDLEPPANVSATHDMEIQPAIRRAIYEVEYSAYVKYGFKEE